MNDGATIRQLVVRPGYGLPDGRGHGVDVLVTSCTGGATWGCVTGTASAVRAYLSSVPAPVPSTWDGVSARRSARCVWPEVVLQPMEVAP